MGDFIITADNYYSREADIAYMSCSQYQDFGECEAKAVAKLQGRWEDPLKEAFTVGNYFHSHFEGPEAHGAFCTEHEDEIFKSKMVKDKKTGTESKVITGKYAPYLVADKMIKTVEADPMMTRFIDMDGENERFMVGNIFGVPWKIKIDKYIPSERFIVDYKTTQNIWDTSFNPFKGVRESFIESHGYTMRAAVYSMIEMENTFGITFAEALENLDAVSALPLPDFFLLCVSKQDPPDKDIFRTNNKQGYLYELENIKKRLPRIVDLRERRALPKRCGVCDYCRSTKQITRIKSAYEISPEFRANRAELEEDYNASFEDMA